MEESPETRQPQRRRWPVWIAIASVYVFPLMVFQGFADAFLKFGGIKGESTATGFEDWIEIDEESDGLTRLISAPPRVVTGTTAFTDVVIKKKLDLSSPALFFEAVSGSITPEATFVFTKSSGTAAHDVFYKVEIEAVFVSGIETSIDDASGTAEETVTLNFNRIEKNVIQFDAAGDHVAEATAFWDLTALTGGLTLNTAPTISDILDTNTEEDIPLVISFTVGDAETAPGLLMLSSSSTNTILVPAANIVFGGADATRDATITPAPDQTGMTTITIEASDGTLTAKDAFILTVDPEVFDQWRRDNFDAAELLDPLISGAEADADNDKLKNLGEFGLGTAAGVSLNPKEGDDAGSAVTVVLVDDGGVDYPALLFNRRTAASDPKLTIAVEQTEDLVDWGSGPGRTVNVQVVPIAGTPFEQALIRSAHSIDDQPKQSLRIRFSR